MDPSVEALVGALRSCLSECAISKVVHPLPRTESIDDILSIYDWDNICLRLMCVYDTVMKIPKKSYWDQIKGFWSQGFGSFLLLLAEWFVLVVMNIIMDVL